MSEHTPGPWSLRNLTVYCGGWLAYPLKKTICTVRPYPQTSAARQEGAANARIIAASVDLFEAALRLEMAELAHANCEECGDEPELAPECCAVCFPLFDDARVMRRNAIAKARGQTLTSPVETPNG